MGTSVAASRQATTAAGPTPDRDAIEESDAGVEEVDGHLVEVAYDTEMTCQLAFTPDDETRVDVIVEDLGDTQQTPGGLCDAGYAALADVIEKAA